MSKLARVMLVAGLLAGLSLFVPAAQANTSGVVNVQTVPALAGVPLSVGGQSVVTGSGGTVSVSVADLNGIASSVSLQGSSLGAGMTAQVTKIAVLPHTGQHVSNVEVGLAVTSSVRLTISPGRTGVPVSSITAIRLRAITGQSVLVRPNTSTQVSLLSRLARLQHGQMVAQTVTWSVERIIAAPGVAVTSGRPRFDPFGAGTWPLTLQVVHGLLHIRTVPAMAGVQFLVEGGSVTTGKGGTATAAITDINHSTGVALAAPSVGSAQVRLLKVTKERSKIQRQRSVVAALEVRRPVTLSFADISGRTVPADRVSFAVLRADGQFTVLDSAQVLQPVLLLAEKATMVHDVWQVHRVDYSVTSARIDGGDAVFTGQQHFFADTPDAAWRVQLSVFRVTVTAHDALLGIRLGSHVVITRPDGSIYSRNIASSGTPTALTSIVRGAYRLRFSAAVLGDTTSVRVSRSDSVDVRLVTGLDVAAVAAALILCVALGVFGAVRVGRQERKQ